MDRERLARLSQRQKECLRLVLSHGSSKAIGLALGLSDSTVSNHLKAAMANLGVSDRYAAARLLRAFEGEAPSPNWTSPPQAIDPPPDFLRHGATETGAPAGPLDQQEEPAQVTIAEEQTPFGSTDHGFQRLPVPYRGRPINDLSIIARLIWIGLIALMAILAVGGALGALTALSHLLTGNKPL